MWKFLLKLFGWEIKGKEYISEKSVVAVAPHTSFLDGFYGYIAMKALGVNFKVVSAEWLFFWPFKYIMKYVLHAFPVGPKSGNAINKSLQILRENDKVNLVICPEGRLKQVIKWNPGFYYIAKRAHVPLDIVTFNYHSKTIFIDSFNIENLEYEDLLCWMRKIYYNKAYAKYPKKFSVP